MKAGSAYHKVGLKIINAKIETMKMSAGQPSASQTRNSR
jgi:hypothetical protein